MSEGWVFLLAGASLVLLGFAAAQAFDRFRFPDYFILMSIGLVLGSGIVPLPVDPRASLQLIAPVLSSVAIAFILFEGGLVLHVRGLRRIWGAAGSHTVAAMALSIAGVWLIGTQLLGLASTSSLVMALAFCGPSASIDISMLSQLKVSERTRFTIIVEGVMGNVVAAVFVLFFIQVSGLSADPNALPAYFGYLVATVALAYVVGFAWSRVVRVKARRFAFMTSVAIAVLLYAIGEGMLGGNGGIAAFVFGLVLGHDRVLAVDKASPQGAPGPRGLQEFHSELVFLLRTFFFLYLGIRVNLTGISTLVILGAFGFVAAFAASRLPSTAVLSKRWRLPKNDSRVLRATVSRGMTDTVLILFAIETGYIPSEEASFVTSLLFLVIVSAAAASALLIAAAERSARRAPRAAVEPEEWVLAPSGPGGPQEFDEALTEFLNDPVVRRSEIQ